MDNIELILWCARKEDLNISDFDLRSNTIPVHLIVKLLRNKGLFFKQMCNFMHMISALYSYILKSNNLGYLIVSLIFAPGNSLVFADWFTLF